MTFLDVAAASAVGTGAAFLFVGAVSAMFKLVERLRERSMMIELRRGKVPVYGVPSRGIGTCWRCGRAGYLSFGTCAVQDVKCLTATPRAS